MERTDLKTRQVDTNNLRTRSDAHECKLDNKTGNNSGGEQRD
jgi:hypothetical protein